MIATHNIKVNGRWIHAGEEYELEPTVKAEEPETVKEAPEAEAPDAEPEQKPEPKPKTSRRKKISE